MTPVVLEGVGIGLPSEAAARRLAGPASVAIVGVALGALVLARGPLAQRPPGPGEGGPSPTPPATLAPTPTAPAAEPTPPPTAPPTPSPIVTPAPTATPRPATYQVRSGDTLSAIAAQFGTTVGELAALNDIANPSLIRVGQVLQLP